MAADAQRDGHALPSELQARVSLVPDWQAASTAFDAALLHGQAADALVVQRALALRPGPIVGLTVRLSGATDVPLERLLTEHAVSANTAAAGGNASLMALG